jgi:hypothetical protein
MVLPSCFSVQGATIGRPPSRLGTRTKKTPTTPLDDWRLCQIFFLTCSCLVCLLSITHAKTMKYLKFSTLPAGLLPPDHIRTNNLPVFWTAAAFVTQLFYPSFAAPPMYRAFPDLSVSQ